MEFKKGDIIKGLPNNGYGITDEDMTRAKVLKTYGKKMDIEVLEHRGSSHIGETFEVLNSDEKFKLVRTYEMSRQELLDMPIGSMIITSASNHDTFIKVEKDDWCNNDCDYIASKDITEDLKIVGSCFVREAEILKVEKPTYDEVYNREEAVKEMTVAEIEKELGYSIKVIKEEK